MAALAALAVAGGAWGLAAEQSHLLSGGYSPQDRIARIVSGERSVGLSSQTQRQYMIDCRNGVIIAAQMQLPAEQRDRLAKTCMESAERVIDAAPASSFAWFAKAHAALALGDWIAMNAALAKSQATGANEGWIARYRVELVEDNRSRIDPAYMPRHLNDLAVLTDNIVPYRDFLARLYLARPGSRADLTDAIERLPPESQRTFLSAVERLRRVSISGSN